MSSLIWNQYIQACSRYQKLKFGKCHSDMDWTHFQSNSICSINVKLFIVHLIEKSLMHPLTCIALKSKANWRLMTSSQRNSYRFMNQFQLSKNRTRGTRTFPSVIKYYNFMQSIHISSREECVLNTGCTAITPDEYIKCHSSTLKIKYSHINFI